MPRATPPPSYWTVTTPARCEHRVFPYAPPHGVGELRTTTPTITRTSQESPSRRRWGSESGPDFQNASGREAAELVSVRDRVHCSEPRRKGRIAGRLCRRSVADRAGHWPSFLDCHMAGQTYGHRRCGRAPGVEAGDRSECWKDA